MIESTYPRVRLSGTGVQIATGATQVAGAAVSSAISTGAILSTSWIPVVGVAVLGVTLALNAIFNRRSAKQKVAATHIVDELEPQLRANVAAYMDGPRTYESQALALQNFDRAFEGLRSSEECGSPQLDDAGRRCISERDRGGKWDWYSYYRDPIANDTRPAELAAAATPAATIDQAASTLFPNSTPEQRNTYAAVAGLALVAVGVFAL